MRTNSQKIISLFYHMTGVKLRIIQSPGAAGRPEKTRKQGDPVP